MSECSDVEEEGYADFTKDDLEPFISMVDGMKLRPTNNERVRQLFDDHRQVIFYLIASYISTQRILGYFSLQFQIFHVLVRIVSLLPACSTSKICSS